VRKLVGGKRIDNVDDVLKVGQKVQVELKEIDPRGKLSLAAVLPDSEGEAVEVDSEVKEPQDA
jgi:polyribonucleotide nucleotidyltransferase